MKILTPVLGAALGLLTGMSPAFAWNPPSGPSKFDADAPLTPTTPLSKGHAWITQAAISVLYNDGYWFAADKLRENQNHILSGNRWQDVRDGDQRAVLVGCAIPLVGISNYCPDWLKTDIKTIDSWPLSAVNHYYNPDTKKGLDFGSLTTLQYWQIPTGGIVFIDIRPNLGTGGVFPATTIMAQEFGTSTGIYRGDTPANPIGARSSKEALGFFYLGSAVHLVQDLNVVHHTYDEFSKNHSDYENEADKWIAGRVLPTADDGWTGRYLANVPQVDCSAGEIRCLATNAAQLAHVKADLDAAENKNYSAAASHVRSATEFTAGVFHEFFVKIGEEPVNVPAALRVIL
ncbi:MAG: hypothetical protein SF187_19185 [Deltaproteobacteria bacterium]|nr:hypothetical protein [Deltaproteobacteria bacterium]